jgi:hypothetical protein
MKTYLLFYLHTKIHLIIFLIKLVFKKYKNTSLKLVFKKSQKLP